MIHRAKRTSAVITILIIHVILLLTISLRRVQSFVLITPAHSWRDNIPGVVSRGSRWSPLGISSTLDRRNYRPPCNNKTTRNLQQQPRRLFLVPTSLSTDPSYCLTMLLGVSVFGISLEQTTQLGKALSAPLVTMALALILSNIGIMPHGSPIYDVINQYFVGLAVPMLLYDSNIRRMITDTGSLLACFGIGAFATVVGTIVGFYFIPMKSIGQSSAWKIACALAARHIGGAINFVAVAETLAIPGTAVSAAIAADNVVVALYFAFLFGIARAHPKDATTTTTTVQHHHATNESTTTSSSLMMTKTIQSELDYSVNQDENDDKDDASKGRKHEITLSTLSASLAISSLLVTFGKILTRSLLPSGTSALPLTSLLTVCSATTFPKFFGRIRQAGTALGILFIQMFFAVSGAAGSIALVLQQAPSLFAFSALQIAIHFVVLMGVGKFLFRLPSNELYLASNANVGGPTTAAAMAQAKNWKRLVLPALLVGILGYATATAIALALGPVLLHMPVFR